MNVILMNAPRHFTPAAGTLAHKLLSLLSDGKPHTKAEIIGVLGDDPRSPLQSLTGSTYGFWLIHNIGDKKAIYQLDERHLSGCSQEDETARVIARKRLKDRSKAQCEREVKRLPKALKELQEALEEYQRCFKFYSED